jgi:hypothetical protein
MMFSSKASRIFLVIISATLLISCGREISKGDVYQLISKDIHIGADKSEVKTYLESLEINGIKPTIYDDYKPEQLNFNVDVSEEKSVKVEGMIFATFRSRGIQLFNFCPSAGVIFYFDRSNKLITYHIDCFR